MTGDVAGQTDAAETGRHRVVVVGGGFGGVQAVRKLRRAPVEITLIDRRNFPLFQPLVYQVATGALSPGEVASPLRGIFKRDKNVRVAARRGHGLRSRARGGCCSTALPERRRAGRDLPTTA